MADLLQHTVWHFFLSFVTANQCDSQRWIPGQSLAKHKATKGTSKNGDIGVDAGQIGGRGGKDYPVNEVWEAMSPASRQSAYDNLHHACPPPNNRSRRHNHLLPQGKFLRAFIHYYHLLSHPPQFAPISLFNPPFPRPPAPRFPPGFPGFPSDVASQIFLAWNLWTLEERLSQRCTESSESFCSPFHMRYESTSSPLWQTTSCPNNIFSPLPVFFLPCLCLCVRHRLCCCLHCFRPPGPIFLPKQNWAEVLWGYVWVRAHLRAGVGVGVYASCVCVRVLWNTDGPLSAAYARTVDKPSSVAAPGLLPAVACFGMLVGLFNAKRSGCLSGRSRAKHVRGRQLYCSPTEMLHLVTAG